MSQPWIRSNRYRVHIETIQPHVPANQNNYRQKRLSSNRDTFLSCVSEIESWILNFTKMDSQYDSREFHIAKQFRVDNRLKHQQKSQQTLPGVVCWGETYSGMVSCYFRHKLPRDYGKIHIYGQYISGVYNFGPRVVWYPNNWTEFWCGN